MGTVHGSPASTHSPPGRSPRPEAIGGELSDQPEPQFLGARSPGRSRHRRAEELDLHVQPTLVRYNRTSSSRSLVDRHSLNRASRLTRETHAPGCRVRLGDVKQDSRRHPHDDRAAADLLHGPRGGRKRGLKPAAHETVRGVLINGTRQPIQCARPLSPHHSERTTPTRQVESSTAGGAPPMSQGATS